MELFHLNQQTIAKRLVDLIKEIKNFEKVSLMDDLFLDLGFDSLNFLDYLVLVENEYNITINESDLDLDNLNSIDKISKVILKYVGE